MVYDVLALYLVPKDMFRPFRVRYTALRKPVILTDAAFREPSMTQLSVAYCSSVNCNVAWNTEWQFALNTNVM